MTGWRYSRSLARGIWIAVGVVAISVALLLCFTMPRFPPVYEVFVMAASTIMAAGFFVAACRA